MHANEVVSRDRLIEALWPSRPPRAADHSLDVQVSRLRKALEPDEPLATRSGGYVLEVDPEQIDVRRFERLLEEGRRANADGEPTEALAALDARARRSGAETRSATSRYEEFARRPRSSGSRSCGSSRSRSVSTPSSRSDATTRLVPRARVADLRSIRCASGFAGS